jgi:hypothetical protein
MIGYDRLSIPADLAPSVLKPNRAPNAAMGFSSYCATACMLGARLGLRAAEDGHLTLLSAHGCMGCQVLWLPTHPMNANDTGECAERDLALPVLQDRALINQNLGPTVGQ